MKFDDRIKIDQWLYWQLRGLRREALIYEEIHIGLKSSDGSVLDNPLRLKSCDQNGYVLSTSSVKAITKDGKLVKISD